MNSAIELHDSEISALVVAEGNCRLEFSHAYIHCSDGEPGIDSWQGFSQLAALLFRGAKTDSTDVSFPQTIGEGSISAGGESVGLLGLPFARSGEVLARFEFVSGAILSISATSVECYLHGEPRLIESFRA